MGLTGGVTGSGRPDDPWRVEIASEGVLRLDLAAWNARDATTPDGEQRLRIGLLATATAAPVGDGPARRAARVRPPRGGHGPVRLVGEQRLELALDTGPRRPLGGGRLGLPGGDPRRRGLAPRRAAGGQRTRRGPRRRGRRRPGRARHARLPARRPRRRPISGSARPIPELLRAAARCSSATRCRPGAATARSRSATCSA